MARKNREKYYKTVGDRHKFLTRITKTLYYGKLASTDRLSLPVTELASELFSDTHNGRSLERLYSNDAAAISRKACVSPCSLVLALLYIDRLKARNPDYLQRTAPSDLFLVSLMVSSKFLHDDGEEDEVFVDEWAVAGGTSIKELIQLEKDFLNAIDWQVYVNQDMFWKKLEEVETSVAKREGLHRGWFTYTELHVFLKQVELYNLVQCVASFSVILAATYTAGILIIVGSMLIVSQIPGNCLDSKRAEQALNEIKRPTVDISSINNDFSYQHEASDITDFLQQKTILSSTEETKLACNNSSVALGFPADDIKDASWWCWWASALKEWALEKSRSIKSFDIISHCKISYFDNYFDMSFATSKKFDLEDQIHKATRLRLQDQMESSWHKEWTDTIQQGLYKKEAFPGYIQNVKL